MDFKGDPIKKWHGHHPPNSSSFDSGIDLKGDLTLKKKQEKKV